MIIVHDTRQEVECLIIVVSTHYSKYVDTLQEVVSDY